MQLFSSWTGSDFLFVYGALLAASALSAWWIPLRWRPAGRPGDTPDFEGAALLAGGRARHVEAVLTDLYARGGIAEAKDGRLLVARRDLPAGPAGKALLALSEPLTLSNARRTIDRHAERLTARLRRSGFLMWPDVQLRLRWLSVAPFAALLVLGLYRQRGGTAEGEPTAPLVVLLGLTLVFAAIRFAAHDPRTRAGMAAVSDLRAHLGSRIARAEDAAMAVALRGTGALAGTPWEPLHAALRKGSGGGADESGQADGGTSCDAGGDGGCGD